MLSRSHEDIGTYSNLFILPMAFFSGTFSPVEKVPASLKSVIYLLPLTHTNYLIRKTSLDREGLNIPGGTGRLFRGISGLWFENN
jgi:ABC-2 type transport system permease protein